MESTFTCMTLIMLCDQVGPSGVLQLMNISSSNNIAGQLQAASIMLNGSRSSIRTAFLTLQGTPPLCRAQCYHSCCILAYNHSCCVGDDTHLFAGIAVQSAGKPAAGSSQAIAVRLRAYRDISREVWVHVIGPTSPPHYLWHRLELCYASARSRITFLASL